MKEPLSLQAGTYACHCHRKPILFWCERVIGVKTLKLNYLRYAYIAYMPQLLSPIFNPIDYTIN